LGESAASPIGIFSLSAASITPEGTPPEISDLLRRVKALLAQGGNVFLFRERELYTMTALVNRYTKQPVRVVVGLSLLLRAFNDSYLDLKGGLLEAVSRLFAQNVRIYAYPMTGTDLLEEISGFLPRGLEWSETNGWVSASQLLLAGPLGHLYQYVLASKFLIPLQVPGTAEELIQDSSR